MEIRSHQLCSLHSCKIIEIIFLDSFVLHVWLLWHLELQILFGSETFATFCLEIQGPKPLSVVHHHAKNVSWITIATTN